MVDIKEKVLDRLRPEIVEKLDPSDNVLQYLNEKGFITDVVFSRIINNPIRTEQSRQLVDEVRRKERFDAFIEALRFNNSHRNLADKLVNRLTELSSCSISRYKDPGKVDIMCGKMKTMSRLTVTLHSLCNEGNSKAFDGTLVFLKEKYGHDPDFMFRLLDEQASKQGMLKQGMEEPINAMETLIAHSTNSEVAAMAFLTMKGTLYAGKKSEERALYFLERAKEKSLQMQPCFKTGRVMYAYVHALMDIYEKDTRPTNKAYLIRNIKETIEVHFANSEPEMRDVFTRIFYLKLAFCYLGINFQGGLMLKEVSQEDLKAARFYIEMAEKIAGLFNQRRYMFLLIAKAVLNYRAETPNITGALQLAREAKSVSKYYGFIKERPYISKFIAILNERKKMLSQFEEEMEVDIGHEVTEMDTD